LRAKAAAVTRYQLVFRTDEGDRSELRDSPDFEAHIHGVPLDDGAVIEHGGRRWRVHREEAHDVARFICIPVEPEQDELIKSE
jgi:hypothetical protein